MAHQINTRITVRQFIHDNLALLSAYREMLNGEHYAHFIFVTLHGLENADCDAMTTISFPEDETDSETYYVEIRALAQRLGIDISEEEFNWCSERLW